MTEVVKADAAHKSSSSYAPCFFLREDINEKKRFLLGIARMRGGGGLPMPESSPQVTFKS